VAKCTAIIPALLSSSSNPPLNSYASPNVFELNRMYDELNKARQAAGLPSARPELVRDLMAHAGVVLEGKWLAEENILEKSVSLVAGIRAFGRLVVKLGDKGEEVFWCAPPDRKADSYPPKGVLIVARSSMSQAEPQGPIIQHFIPHRIAPEELVSTTGAGDSLVGTLLACEAINLSRGKHCSLFLRPWTLEASVRDAQAAAIRALKTSRSVAAP
jgi:pseudouridylate synthase / pseudouridine kinase